MRFARVGALRLFGCALVRAVILLDHVCCPVAMHMDDWAFYAPRTICNRRLNSKIVTSYYIRLSV